MLKITRIIVKRFWGLFAFLLISLAVVVVVGRELTPKISEYKQELSLLVGEAMGVQVEVESLTGSWKGLSPELQLSGITLTNQDGAQILYTGDAVARVSLLRSLLNWRFVLRNLELVQVDMNLLQDEQGVWSLVGLSATSTANDSADPFDFFLLSRYIEFRDIQFNFEFRTGHKSQVNLPYLKLENSGSFHRLSSEIAIDRTQDVMSFVIEGKGDPRDIDNFSAKGYLRLQEFELDKAVAALPGELWAGLPDAEWRRGHELDFEAWFDLKPGMEIITQGQFEVGELPVHLAETIPFPEHTQTQFSAHFEVDGGWSISFRDLAFGWGETQAPLLNLGLRSDGLGKPVTVKVQEINLQQWASLLVDVGFLNDQLVKVVTSLNPRGSLKNIQLKIEDTALDAVKLIANMDGLAVDAWNGSPAFTGVSGYINTSPSEGFAELNIQDGLSAFFYPVYDKPMEFDTGKGQIRWLLDYDEGTVKVRSGLLTVEGDEGEINGYFSLFIPFEFGSEQEELVVQAGIRNSDGKYAGKYIPVILPTPLMDWLDSSLGGGKVNSAGFIYRGGLTKESTKNAVTQLFVDVDEADLDYDPRWPKVENVKGQLWLDNTEVFANVESADFLNSKVQSASVYVSKNLEGEGELLKIVGEMEGGTNDGLRVLRESPIRQIIGDRFDSWQSSGRLYSDVNLSIPLVFSEPGARHQIDLRFSDSSLELTDLDLSLDDLNGKVFYDNIAGISSQNLVGKLWQEKINLDIQPILSGSESSRGAEPAASLEAIEIAVRGSADVSKVREWTRLAELNFLSGKTSFLAKLTFPYGDVNSFNGESRDQNISDQETPNAERNGSIEKNKNSKTQLTANLTIETDLVGVGVYLPAPFGKPAEEERNSTISLPLVGGKTAYKLQYDGLVEALLEVQDGQLSRGGISIAGQASLPEEGVLELSGDLDFLDGKVWQEVYQRYGKFLDQKDVTENLQGDLNTDISPQSQPSSLTSIRTRFDLHVNEISFNDFEVHDAQISGQRESRSWRFNVASTEVSGDLEIFDDQESPWILALNYLRIPEKKTDLDQLEIGNPLLALLQPALEKEDYLAGIDPRVLPKVNVTAKEFTLANENYGSWSFRLQPSVSGVVIDHIFGDVLGGTILGNKATAGAVLVWDQIDGSHSSQFVGRFISNDIGNVIEQLGNSKLLESKASQFDADISWRGTPASVAVNLLQGKIDLQIIDGYFYRGSGDQSAGGALLQLFSFLNFDTWVRRLRLDFSDLAGEGMGFDSIQGTIDFNKGEIQLPTPMVVEARASRFQMAGTINLTSLEMDTVVVATLPVGNNLTLLAVLAGNLPAAAGVWVISKVFAKQMNRVASVRFKVTGTLNDPISKFEKLFEDDASKSLKQSNEKPFKDAAR